MSENKPAPTLYAIIAVKLLKGALFLSMALVAYTLSDNDLPYEYRCLLHHLRLNPEKKFFSELALKIGTLSEAKVLWVAAGTAVYSLFSLVEGAGLIFRVSWAGWLAIGESAFFIPIELFEILRRPSWTVGVILLLNVIIVAYLSQNRERLFHHHRRAIDKPGQSIPRPWPCSVGQGR
jgi:uncharacterized membrane protein (DUF2068 family)